MLTVAVPGFLEPQQVGIGGGTSIPCSDPSMSRSILGIGVFVNLGYDASSAQGHLRLHLEAPRAVAEGATLNFVVAITNPSSTPVHLDPCPVYQASLFNAGEVRERYRLNCDQVGGIIGPERTERFAMELRVPRDFLEPIQTKLGPAIHRWQASLEWAIVPIGQQFADARIWVLAD
jgi:hypothetical protein